MRRPQGFTLIELVAVIVVLAIVGLGVSRFISLGADIYADASGREQLVSQTRYALERLTREIREALPNSVRVGQSGNLHCLEFVPIAASASYINIPVAPEPASNQVVLVQPALSSSASRIAVYPLSAADIYRAESTSGKLFSYSGSVSAGTGTTTVTLNRSVLFDQDSPSQRYYLVANAISYCANTATGQLRRYSGYWPTAIQQVPTSAATGVLMMENLKVGSTPFIYQGATLVTNAVVQILFAMVRDGEQVDFHHQVHLLNVP